jgi:ribonuclease P protein component
LKDRHGQGTSNVSTQPASACTRARLPRPDEYEERAAGIEAPSREGPEEAHREQRIGVGGASRFRPHERFRRHADFKTVYSRGVRLNGRFSSIFVLPNQLGAGRLGIAATKKLGDAVRRNRAKRLIRELFRHNKIAPGYDVVVVPRRGLLDVSLSILEADYRNLLGRQVRQRR